MDGPFGMFPYMEYPAIPSAGSPDDPAPQIPSDGEIAKYYYCRYGSAAIGICLDVAGLGLSATGAGLPAGAAIFLVSTANNVVSCKICGSYTTSAASEVLGIASLTIKAGGLKTQAGLAAADVIINLGSVALENN